MEGQDSCPPGLGSIDISCLRPQFADGRAREFRQTARGPNGTRGWGHSVDLHRVEINWTLGLSRIRSHVAPHLIHSQCFFWGGDLEWSISGCGEPRWWFWTRKPAVFWWVSGWFSSCISKWSKVDALFKLSCAPAGSPIPSKSIRWVAIGSEKLEQLESCWVSGVQHMVHFSMSWALQFLWHRKRSPWLRGRVAATVRKIAERNSKF